MNAYENEKQDGKRKRVVVPQEFEYSTAHAWKFKNVVVFFQGGFQFHLGFF